MATIKAILQRYTIWSTNDENRDKLLALSPTSLAAREVRDVSQDESHMSRDDTLPRDSCEHKLPCFTITEIHR